VGKLNLGKDPKGERSYAARLLLLITVTVAGMAVAIRLGFAPASQLRETADFTGLIDTAGHTLNETEAYRRYKLVAFGYTSCPDACPATLTKMHGVLDALRTSPNSIAPIFITLDPAHDTANILGAYVHHFDSRIIGMTGESHSLEASAAQLKALPTENVATRTPDGGPNHAVRLYLLAPDNTLLRTYELNDAAQLIASDVRRRMQPTG